MTEDELQSALATACEPILRNYLKAEFAETTAGFAGPGRLAEMEAHAQADALARHAVRNIHDSIRGQGALRLPRQVELESKQAYDRLVTWKEGEAVFDLNQLKYPQRAQPLVDLVRHADLASSTLSDIRDAASTRLASLPPQEDATTPPVEKLDEPDSPEELRRPLIAFPAARLDPGNVSIHSSQAAIGELELLVQALVPDKRATRQAAQYLNRLVKVINDADDRPQDLESKQRLCDLLNSLKQAFRLEMMLTQGTEKIALGSKVSLSVLVQTSKYPKGRYIFTATKRDAETKQQSALGRSNRLPIRFQLPD